ncbi:hypothetical protein ACKWTF_002694 [Chironomus riparius]
MDTLKKAKKEFQKRLVLPIVDSLNKKSLPIVTNENSNNFTIIAALSNLNLYDTKQNIKTKEENFESCHDLLLNGYNNKLQKQIPFNLSRVDQFKIEIYKDVTYLLKLYGITNDDIRNNKKRNKRIESSNDNNIMSSYVNDVFCQILDINNINCNDPGKIYNKIREDFSAKFALEIYAALIQILVRHETSSSCFYQWSEKFSSEAETILTLYAEYQSISEPYISYAKWIAYTEINEYAVLNHGLFENILDNLIYKPKNHLKNKTAKKLKSKILKQFKNKPCSKKSQDLCLHVLKLPQNFAKEDEKNSYEISKEANQNEEILTIFWDSTKVLIKSFLNFVHELHLTSADGNSNKNVEILEKFFLIMKRLFKIHPNQLKEIDFESNLKEALTDGTVDYFIQNINHKLLAQLDKTIERISELVDILKKSVDYIIKFDDKFGFTFKLCYNLFIPEILFHAYDSHLVNLIHPVISDTYNMFEDEFKIQNNEELLSKVLELYHEISNYLKKSRDIYQVHNLKLLDYSQDWFLAGFDTWREASNMKVIFRIKTSIDVDKLKPEFDNTPYSSSAIDTIQILYSTKTFWENLELLDKRVTFLKEVAYDLCCSVVLYIEKFVEKIINSSENEKNIHKLPSILRLVTSNQNFVLENFKNLIKEFCCVAKFDEEETQRHIKKIELSINEEISDYFAFEMKKFCPLIKQAVIPNCPDEQETIQEIENIIIIMQSDLSASNFQEIEQILWNRILETFSEIIQKSINEKMVPEIFSNLLKTFKKLNQIISSKNDIKLQERIDQTLYKLQCYGQETDELILQYYKDRYKIQKDISNESPIQNSFLTIYCCFIDDTIKIEILNARNLPTNELNKKCDSYVKVQFVPQQKFPHFQSFKTKVQHNTIFPLYDETFQKPLTKEQRNLKNAIVYFAIKEKSLIASDVRLAEAFLSFEDIPQVTSYEKLQQTRLTLTKLRNYDIESLKAIQYRSQMGDVQAMEFLAKIGILPRASIKIKQIYLNIKDLNIRLSPNH